MESLFNRRFPSLEAAHDACDQVARSKGFALIIRTKKPNAKEPRYIHLRYSQGGKKVDTTHDNDEFYDSNRDRKRRRTKTKITDCPFRVIIKKDKVSSTWMVFYSPESNFHNHEFVTPMALTKYYVKVVDKYDNTIISIYNDGIRPVFIITQLRGMAREDLNLASITRK